MSTKPASAVRTIEVKKSLPIAALALAIAVTVQLIGQLKLDVGIGSIIVFPMVWGLIAGVLFSVQKFKPLGIDLQKIAAALVGVAVMLLVARLAFTIGPSLPTLVKAGPALLLQEVGHLLGTVFLALPLAVLLRMGKATVGATFSLDREPSFAMVSEKYGPDSDQYRGVLAMYVFGTLFGAVYITLLTSLVSNWRIFDPLALAMGSGVGSGSMMAASAASITAAYPGDKDAILGMAAVSNLITTILGVYVGIYIALPLADRFYRLLTRSQGAREEALASVPSAGAAAAAAAHLGAAHKPSAHSASLRNVTGHDGDTSTGGEHTVVEHRGDAAPADAEASAEANRRFREQVAASTEEVRLPLWASMSILSIIGIGTASVAAKGFSLSIVGGYAVLVGLVLLSMLLAWASRKISAIVWATTLGALISSPWSPVAGVLGDLVKSVDFLSIATVVLTCAGLSLGKDIPLLRQIGWKIIPVGLVAITASFLLSAVIAEFALGLWH
ncbi:DUF3100 domain-containing protein [Arthrobacter sp. M4]|uniref:DUF3100 domain-containing protein n=1 Tax=Arthrobacter sp. M4 TaxID=218160 RepID=UPI001CDD8B06|nr:DUF3100 domain-containing protein [Arthrobacter sp. M4]MCA4133966.1 DUF3100 domain-containing protein [Arthrobacter sp. M4]